MIARVFFFFIVVRVISVAMF
uniref:Uncharacterized protein n=1 Tax=Rhizophora mucronata TaxID=61149 RepID=A0A2P2R1X1_RHIMU